jgi:regulator of sigma E protease
MSIIIFILILSVLVIIHELGHFFAARFMGMKVEEFGLGYPPRALKLFKWKETLFSLNWIPFGGFVSIKGEDEAAGAFHRFSTNKRLVVILAGAIVNFLFGVLAFSLVFSISGIPTRLKQPRIGEISPNSPAEKVNLPTEVNILGLRVDDELIKTNDVEEVIKEISDHQGETVQLVTTGHCQQLECEEILHEFEVYLRKPAEIPEGQGSLGIIFQPVVYLDYPWYEMPFRGAWYGLIQAFWLGRVILEGLRDLLTNMVTLGQVPEEIAGPVGIVHQATSEGIFAEGYLVLLSFSGMLSINLAVMNVLPIPALDGGRALFVLIEKIVGRKKIERIEQYANYVGYTLLLGLIILVTIRDVIRIFV